MQKQILLLVMLLLPTAASADAVEIDGIYYNLVTKIKAAEVTSNPNKYSGSVVIPVEVKYEGTEYRVTNIGDYAFNRCSGLTSVTIPNSVTSIGNGAFYSCSGLTSVTIPNSVTSIEGLAFCNCSGLRKVIVKDIAAWCGISFSDNTSNPLYYAQHLYSDENTEITELIIPNSVTSIGNTAFRNCSGLTSVAIPNSVTSIGNHAFLDCSGLTSVTIPNSVTSIGNGAFYKCSGLTSVTIPNSVTGIGNDAFSGCSGLTSIVIGVGVKNIYGKAFANCPELTDVTCCAENVPLTESDAFEGSYIEYATLHVRESLINAYSSIEPWRNYKEIVPLSQLIYKVDGDIYKTVVPMIGETIVSEPELTKEGYTFSGWSEIPETMPEHDVIVTGTFTVNRYTITYMIDDEVYQTKSVDYGSTITPPSAPERVGYNLEWIDVPETMPAKDVVITGSFSINSYTITYKIDGEVFKTESVEYGSPITTPDAPEKEGYTFSGWSEILDKMPANDVTIIGTFIKNSLGKCATPVIDIENGKLKFACETDAVAYHYDIVGLDTKIGEGDVVELAELQKSYRITVYATKDDYDDSDSATMDFTLKGDGDANGDGKVDAADIVTIVNIITGK